MVINEVGCQNKDDDTITPFGINIEKYSSRTTLIRVTAWCLRFLSNLEGKEVNKGFSSRKELTRSTFMWIKTFKNIICQN